jgi:hypothetical protein
MTTLTDRYVETTLRRLPVRQRPDIEKELRASIADAVDDRLQAGDDPAEAERAVLTDLGDPVRLAAGYADRPLQLVGPALFPDYTRLLTALLATVLPAVAAAIAVARTVRGDTAASVVGGTVGVTVTVGVHIAFWTTVVFAAYERLTWLRPAARPWSPDEMPEPPGPRSRRGAMVGGTVLAGLFTAFVLLSPRFTIGRDGPAILSPWLWRTGMVYVFLAAAIAGLGFVFVERYARWTVRLAVTGALVEAVGPILLICLAAGERVVDPAFAGAAGWPPSASRWIGTALVLCGVGALARVVVNLVAGLSRGAWVTPNWRALIRTAVAGLSRVPGR